MPLTQGKVVLPGLKPLTQKRATIKRRITRYLNAYVDNETFDLKSESKAFISFKLEAINSIEAEFERLQDQIEAFIDEYETDQDLTDLSEQQADERMSVEESFRRLKAPFQRQVQSQDNSRSASSLASTSASASASPPQATTSNISARSSSRLPEIKIPEFHGNINNWQSFCQLFRTIVDDDDRLTDAQRLLYLQTSVKGEAHNAITSLSPVAENYQVAWTILKGRYENKRVLTKTHLNNLLFKLPSSSIESASSLRQLLDIVTTNLTALKTLKLPIEHWDEILIHIVQTKMDKQTQRDWEQIVSSDENITFDKFKHFIQERCATLEVLSSTPKYNQNISYPRVAPNANRQFHHRDFSNARQVHNATIQSSCPLCKGHHYIYSCKKFQALAVPARRQFIESQQRCRNCLWQKHTSSECTYGRCKLCQRSHHTLLHEEPSSSTTSSAEHPPAHVCHSTKSIRSYASHQNEDFLPTAIIHAYDADGKAHACRVLFDSGSQVNFVRTDLMQKLNLPTNSIDISIATIGNQPSRCSRSGSLTITSRFNAFALSLSCIVVDHITSKLPTQSISTTNFILPNVPLADPHFTQSQTIDILMGVSAFWHCILPNSYKATNKHPHLQDTKFGWIVGGRVNNELPPSSFHALSNLATRDTALTSTYDSSTVNLHETVARMFSLEHDNCQKLSPADEVCERHFDTNYSYSSRRKRFTVRLPFKSEPSVLGESYKMALRRFHALESRLNRSPQLKRLYEQFMAEYLALNHMSVGSAASAKYYLPHHGVMRNDKTTTKLRVVFDASAKTTNALSLNDILLTGPTIQPDLTSILLRFRTYQYVLCGDIEKMYRQVDLDVRDRPFQAILWRRDSRGYIQTYFLNTVTYGVTSAPYLAIRALQQCTKITTINDMEACQTILSDFYVDDLLTGADTLEQIEHIKSTTSNILLEGGFNLRKWSSNHDRITDNTGGVALNKDAVAKLLGVQWSSSLDTITYSLAESTQSSPNTKRGILSLASRLFDPLGIVSPVVIVAKLILRQLWTNQLDWDEPIPTDINERWINYTAQLSTLDQISIPRKTVISQSNHIELIGFCDASQEAYGAAVYIRSISSDNIINAHLLCTKSRVAPIKAITIPRLELCAAVLLANLMEKVKNSLRHRIDASLYFTDSTIVLHWLRAKSRHNQVFVANRTAEIQSLSDALSWRHVRTDENPADLITRGNTPAELAQNDLWWHGPSWLPTPEDTWPVSSFVPAAHTITVVEQWDILNKFSSLSKLTRVLAYCLRFASRCRNHSAYHTHQLSVAELNNARTSIFRRVQQEGLAHLRAPPTATGPLNTLNPFFDDDGLLRVGGRLSQNQSLGYDKCHPIILPRDHFITKIIIRNEHERLMHAGPSHTLASLREVYWPLSGKTQVRSIINKCISCRKARPQMLSQIMGNLPRARITPSRSFSHTGVDYAGPIKLAEGRGRGKRSVKAYIALFVCFATKAIHLELVSDCSTPAFLAAFRRFIARRGMIAEVYSDNGTNFKGAKNELNQLAELLRSESFANNLIKGFSNVTWHFIPPNSPHWGGLWEAGVKAVKSHLKRVIGDQTLTFEEYGTLLTQVEACVNSRPLCPLSSDPNDLLPLTPAHFLVGNTLTSIPEPSYDDVPINRLTRWQLIQHTLQQFWKRWSVDYLHQLQQRPKWQKKRSNIAPGTLVMLKENNLPPYVWVMGRVTEVFQGQNDAVRAVIIRTANGTFKRTVNRLSLLMEP